MHKVSKFSKVSFEQFKSDWLDAFPALNDEDPATYNVDEHLREIYDSIELPKRATYMSAGYDVFAPVNFMLEPGESIKIPTGLRCEMYDGWVLTIHPRSGLGFKYGLGLANHTAIIDGDYYDADNEGHIQVKLVNDSCLAKDVLIKQGEAFCQGIFLPFGITLDDDTTIDDVRTGGFGSTTKQ